MRGYVTAFVGPRDFYEVPVALNEGGILTTHVSDFYAPGFLADVAGRISPRLGKRLSVRRRPELPWRKTRSDIYSTVRQILDPHRQKDAIRMAYLMDKSLSLKAAKLARVTDSALFLYSGVAHWAFQAMPDKPRVLFQFHPHPAAVRALLERDLERHPEVIQSFETEYDSTPLDRLPQENLVEWQGASHIVCASAFTSRSLQEQGCPPSRISIIPYGLADWFARDVPAAGPGSVCNFLFVGQGIQRKGVHHLLKAWKLAGLKSSALTLVCSRIDPGIAKLAEQPGVTLLSKLSGGDLKSRYLMSDIFVMPSMVEGFGLVYGEALAAGLHCIGTHNTGLPDLSPPAGAATIVEAGNIDLLAEALGTSYKLWERGELDKSFIRTSCRASNWTAFRRGILELAQKELRNG